MFLFAAASPVDTWLQRFAEVAAFAFPIIAFLWGGAVWVARKFSRLEKNLAAITAQVHNNGGKSLKDVADRTERAVAVVSDRIDDVEQGMSRRLDTVASDVARLTGRFDEHARNTSGTTH